MHTFIFCLFMRVFVYLCVCVCMQSYNAESNEMELTTYGECQYKQPSIELDTNTSYLPVGTEGWFMVNGTLRNNDVNCPTAAFQFSGSVPFGFGGRIMASKVYLLPNETRKFLAYFSSSDITPSGRYEMTISVSEGSVPAHSAGAKAPITVNCTERPEAPHSFTFTQDTPLFSSKTRITVKWKACESGVFCCGPCTWKVYRDGKYVGTSDTRSFTDDSPATKGESYSYKVVTYDSRGVASADDSCKNSANVVGESADLTNFLILITGVAVVVVAIIIGVIVVVVFFNKNRIARNFKLLRARITTKHDPDLEVELLNEAPKV